jgi:hypothetical protein
MPRAGPAPSVILWESFDIFQMDHSRLREATKNRVGCFFSENQIKRINSQFRQNEECLDPNRLYIQRNKRLTSDTAHYVMDFSVHVRHTFPVQQFFTLSTLNLSSKFCLIERSSTQCHHLFPAWRRVRLSNFNLATFKYWLLKMSQRPTNASLFQCIGA